jgi:hypothetical protein
MSVAPEFSLENFAITTTQAAAKTDDNWCEAGSIRRVATMAHWSSSTWTWVPPLTNRTDFTGRQAKTSFPASYDVDRATNGLRVSVTEAQGEQ